MKTRVLSLFLSTAFAVFSAPNHSRAEDDDSLDVVKLAGIHDHLSNNIKNGRVPGAVVLVAQNGKIVHYEAAGYSDIESGKALTKETVFRLASMSKPITGVAILILVGQGRISLNDPLSKYIPQFKDLKVAVESKENSNKQPDGTVSSGIKHSLVPAAREVTIKDLLTHSSGIGQGNASAAEINKIVRKPNETLADYIPKLAGAPLDFQPGTMTGYSALAGFDILGRVVEIVSGESLDKFLSKNLFIPLEMKNTGFSISGKGVQEGIPVIYKRTDQGMARDAQQSALLDDFYFSGSAGMVGTMEDYYHFAEMLAGGGVYKGKRIFSEDLVKEMSSPQLADTIKGFSPGQSWGLSVRVVTEDNGSPALLTKGCWGWSGAWGTHFWIDPVHKIVALYMTNVSNIGGSGADTAREFERDVMAALPAN